MSPFPSRNCQRPVADRRTSPRLSKRSEAHDVKGPSPSSEVDPDFHVKEELDVKGPSPSSQVDPDFHIKEELDVKGPSRSSQVDPDFLIKEELEVVDLTETCLPVTSRRPSTRHWKKRLGTRHETSVSPTSQVDSRVEGKEALEVVGPTDNTPGCNGKRSLEVEDCSESKDDLKVEPTDISPPLTSGRRTSRKLRKCLGTPDMSGLPPSPGIEPDASVGLKVVEPRRSRDTSPRVTRGGIAMRRYRKQLLETPEVKGPSPSTQADDRLRAGSGKTKETFQERMLRNLGIDSTQVLASQYHSARKGAGPSKQADFGDHLMAEQLMAEATPLIEDGLPELKALKYQLKYELPAYNKDWGITILF